MTMHIQPELETVIKKHFMSEVHKMQGGVVITSAYPMTQHEIDLIVSKFPYCKGKEISNVVDPEVIGGFILSYGSKIIDLSLQTLLQSVRQKLYED